MKTKVFFGSVALKARGFDLGLFLCLMCGVYKKRRENSSAFLFVGIAYILSIFTCFLVHTSCGQSNFAAVICT